MAGRTEDMRKISGEISNRFKVSREIIEGKITFNNFAIMKNVT